MGARSAGNPHAACDAEGAGNVARPRYWDTRRRKGEPTGKTNFGLNRRASPRPYRKSRSSFFNRAAGGKRFFPLEAVFLFLACYRFAKKTLSELGQACPVSEQEGPARVAQCPHERRSGARGRCLFAHRGKSG